MKYSIEYDKNFDPKKVAALSHIHQQEIQDVIEKKLGTAPEVFGKPLQHSFKGSRRLRVGDYRVIFFIKAERVIIVDIDHRSKIYKTN